MRQEVGVALDIESLKDEQKSYSDCIPPNCTFDESLVEYRRQDFWNHYLQFKMLQNEGFNFKHWRGLRSHCVDLIRTDFDPVLVGFVNIWIDLLNNGLSDSEIRQGYVGQAVEKSAPLKMAISKRDHFPELGKIPKDVGIRRLRKIANRAAEGHNLQRAGMKKLTRSFAEQTLPQAETWLAALPWRDHLGAYHGTAPN